MERRIRGHLDSIGLGRVKDINPEAPSFQRTPICNALPLTTVLSCPVDGIALSSSRCVPP